MENLTKENFWNELQEKYPVGMKVFCDWIDEYKKKNNWIDLFGCDQISQRQHYWADIKFHHIPLAFQIGMWIEFIGETFITVHEWEIEDLSSYDWRESIRQHIKILNEAV